MKTAARPKHTATIVALPETDHMGESILQALISELLRPLLARFLLERGERAFVGADQFFYYDPEDISRRIAPDVYVIPGIEGPRDERVWRCWELEAPPSFALEIVGRDVAKDYEDVLVDYKAIGVRELVVFDPDWTPRSRARVRWQVWRKVKKRDLVCVLRSNEDRVESSVLRCWLRLVGEGGDRRVRLATGELGATLVPTDAERAEQERARAEHERQSAAQERARAEHERTLRAAIERERDELRAALAATKAPRRPKKKRA
ncbi:MAG: Uma2 family endonuclease [Myxococcales bacterium]|nr:Uma2 family endonuclease [Myxococcales bacterium]